MDSVFLVEHSYEVNEIEETKLIGIYSSRENAEKVIEKYKEIIGFKDYPDGFIIDEYKINANHWQEGFIGWDDAIVDDDVRES